MPLKARHAELPARKAFKGCPNYLSLESFSIKKERKKKETLKVSFKIFQKIFEKCRTRQPKIN